MKIECEGHKEWTSGGHDADNAALDYNTGTHKYSFSSNTISGKLDNSVHTRMIYSD